MFTCDVTKRLVMPDSKPRDGTLYLSLTHMIDSFSCIPFISESGLLIMPSLRLPYCDDNTVTFSDVITFSDVNLNDGILLRARHNEKEMKVKPATSFKLLTIFIHKKKIIRQDSKQKNASKQYLSRLCHRVPQKQSIRIYKTNPLNNTF